MEVPGRATPQLSSVPSSPLSTPLSSSPLSVLSKSPSPPAQRLPVAMDASKRYPSPTSSAAPSGSASPIKSDTTEEICVRTDGMPPAKRRKVAAPKQRTTEYVDLQNLTDEDEAHLDRLLSALRKKKKIVVIAGAGISVSAGIPDFRSSTGLFSTLRGEHKLKGSGKHLFDAAVYKHDSSTTSFHKMVRRMAEQISEAKPTPFHHMLASIAEEGRLLRLYTQNIDCIDTNMPPLATTVPLNNKGPWPKSIQLHGGLDKMVCSKCGTLETFEPSLFNGPEPPPCKACLEQEQVRIEFAGKRGHGVGKLRPRIVLYNEHHPDQDAIGNVSKADLRRVPDAVIVVGTTLKVPGVRRIVKEMCQVTRSRRDGFTAWINVDPEPQGPDLKDCWDLVVRGKCDDIAQLTGLPHWDEQDIGDMAMYMVYPGDEKKLQQYEERVKKGQLAVDIQRKRKVVSPEPDEIKFETPSRAEARSKMVGQIQDAGIPTPSASPRHRSPLPAKPLAKTKQSKLVFGNSVAAKESTPPKATTAKTAKARKPLKSSRGEAKPKNNITGAFKATKNVASTGKKPGMGIKVEDVAVKENMPVKALPDLQPSPDQTVTNGQTRSPQPPMGRPVTPPAVDESPHQTVSPPSKPRRMELLID